LIALLNTFHGLTLPEIESLLAHLLLPQLRTRPAGLRARDSSDELLILLSGRLSIRSEAGDALANIEPGAPVGEMGVFTEQPRSASVIAMEAANGLRISKKHLFRILQTNKEMHFKILQNLLCLLSRRLAEANEANAEHAETIIHMPDLLVRYTGKTAGELT
jgi:CRP-like cAMP-binding protein